MVTAVFSDGDTQKVRANEGFYLGGGAAIIDDAKDSEYHVTLAYKFALIDADRRRHRMDPHSARSARFLPVPRVRFGGGLTYHINPRLEGGGSAGGLDVDFKNALGAVLQADSRVNQMIGVGARFTMLEYDAEGRFRQRKQRLRRHAQHQLLSARRPCAR